MGMSLRATKHTQKDPITVRRTSEFHSRVKKSSEQAITVIRRIHLRYHPYVFVLFNKEQVITLYQLSISMYKLHFFIKLLIDFNRGYYCFPFINPMITKKLKKPKRECREIFFIMQEKSNRLSRDKFLNGIIVNCDRISVYFVDFL